MKGNNQAPSTKHQTGDRLPPNSPEAERGVLGCIMLSPQDCMGECVVKLKHGADCFYGPENAAIYSQMSQLYQAGTEIDSVTLYEAMRNTVAGGEIADLLFIITTLGDAVPSAANLTYYLDIVKEKYTMRRMVEAYTRHSDQVMSHEGDVDGLLAEMDRLNAELNEDRITRGEQSAGDVMKRVMENRVEKFRQGVKLKIGPATGFNYLDNIVPGFGAGQFIVLAARPSTGKTALMMQIAENVCEKEKLPVAVFSLEMTDESLMLRAVCQRAGVDVQKLTNGFMENSDTPKLIAAAGEICALPLYIDEQPRLCIEELEVKARRLKRQRGVGMIIIDYFQLMYVRHGRRGWNQNEELADISKRLKALAKELSIPIVVCAQLNREVEKEAHRRPRGSDLRDTGQLEQDADVILMLWRPDMTLAKHETRLRNILHRMDMVPRAWTTMEENEEGKRWDWYLDVINVWVEKQREGRRGVDAAMVFVKPWTRFVDAYRPPRVREEPSSNSQAPNEVREEQGEMV